MEKEIPWKKKPGQAILISEQSRIQNSSPQPFWHQALVLWKTIFPQTWGGGMASGWFEHITFIVYFISNLILSLIWQVVLVHSPQNGDPCFRTSNITGIKKRTSHINTGIDSPIRYTNSKCFMYLKFQKHISKTDRIERKNYNCVFQHNLRIN